MVLLTTYNRYPASVCVGATDKSYNIFRDGSGKNSWLSMSYIPSTWLQNEDLESFLVLRYEATATAKIENSSALENCWQKWRWFQFSRLRALRQCIRSRKVHRQSVLILMLVFIEKSGTSMATPLVAGMFNSFAFVLEVFRKASGVYCQDFVARKANSDIFPWWEGVIAGFISYEHLHSDDTSTIKKRLSANMLTGIIGNVPTGTANNFLQNGIPSRSN